MTTTPEPERCSHRPEELPRQPVGFYHCPHCLCMCLAGYPHHVTGHDEECPYHHDDEPEAP